MTTRRNILKGGAGLAAILASGKAPAYLVKSMIAARNSIGTRACCEKLPYDAEVEYLESTGTQWIDTGIVPTLYTKSEVVAKFTAVSSSQICGAFWDGVNNAFDICGVANNSWFLRAFTSGSPNPSGWTADTNTHTFVSDAQTNTMSVDSVSVTRSAISIGTPVSIYMFARHERSTGADVTYPCQVKIYSVRFYDNGVLVRDFIPVRVGGAGYMYDRVSKQLFGNQGTGNFIVGPDVVEVEYLESTGTQWIDTGIFPTANVGALMDVMPFNGGSDTCALFCGSDTWRWGFGFRLNYTIQFSCLSRSVAFQNIDWYPGGSRKVVDYNYSQPYKAYIDGVLVYDNIPHGTVESPGAIWMFAANYNGTGVVWRPSKIRIYSCKMIDNGVLVRDFVPVRVGMEGAMMDRLTRKIYRNAGTGAFKIGADRKETPLMCNSYVKDGLVAMWDGVENAGWGVHNGNATTWKDLTNSGYDLTVSNTASFSSNSLQYPPEAAGNNGAAYMSGLIGSSETYVQQMEVCSNVTGTQNNGWGIVVANGQANSNNQSRIILTMRIGRGFQTSYAKTHAAFLPEAGDICVSATKDDLYVKGILIQDTTFASVDWNGGMNNFNIFGRGDSVYKTYGKVYCIRIYSRALTAEEIAWNYEIDRRRFNLT